MSIRALPGVHAAALLAAILLTAPARAELRLVPEPRKVTAGGGRLALSGDVTIALSGGDAEDRFAAEGLRDEIASTCGIQAKIVDRREGTIVLARKANAAGGDDESYRIDVAPSGARLSAGSSAGLFYATQTLRQMIEPGGIPAAKIEDRPELRWRGVHDDLSRGPLPTVETLERRIRTAAELKFNFYVLYLETAYAYRAHPLLGPPGGALSDADVRRLVAYARRQHVELVPEQQTTGHLSNILRFERYAGIAETPHGSTLAPGPESDTFIHSLYDELLPLFPGPFVHLGADEIGDIGKGRTQKQVAAEGADAVYLKHLKSLCGIVKPYGKRPMFWSDVCLDRPALVKGLPPELVAASWCYESKSDYSRWITPFRDAKVDLIVCPGAINWNRVFPNLDVALPNIRDFIHEGQRAGAIGALTCVWDDNGDAPFDLNWYALAGAAAASWQMAALDTTNLHRAFDWVMFRNPGTDAADAITLMQQDHRLVMNARTQDANLPLYWQNPLNSTIDRQQLGVLEPKAAEIRLNAELALEHLAHARAAARRNVEVLDENAFAARRLHAIGMRAAAAKRIPALYQSYLAKSVPGTPVTEARAVLGDINALLVEGRDTEVALRAEHEALWLRQNRPYWLGNILALYDRDTQAWLSKLDTMRQLELLLRMGVAPPPAKEIGLAP